MISPQLGGSLESIAATSGGTPPHPDCSFSTQSSGMERTRVGQSEIDILTDVDGSAPDAWRYMVEVQDPGKPADSTGYR